MADPSGNQAIWSGAIQSLEPSRVLALVSGSTSSMANLLNSPSGLSAIAIRFPSGDHAGPDPEKKLGLFRVKRFCSPVPSAFATSRLDVFSLLEYLTKTNRLPSGEKLMGLSTSTMIW